MWNWFWNKSAIMPADDFCINSTRWSEIEYNSYRKWGLIVLFSLLPQYIRCMIFSEAQKSRTSRFMRFHSYSNRCSSVSCVHVWCNIKHSEVAKWYTSHSNFKVTSDLQLLNIKLKSKRSCYEGNANVFTLEKNSILGFFYRQLQQFLTLMNV